MDRESPPKPSKPKRLVTLLPYVWELVRPRVGLLLLGLGVLVVNRGAGLVLPASTKFLIDDVLGRGDRDLLWRLVGAVMLATVVQGATSFALTHLLSKEAQRLIAQLRSQVQAHVGRLPLAYYDRQKTGALVSRIMGDVEGIRNLIGTGLVQLLGGLMTAAMALAVLLWLSPRLTVLAFLLIVLFGLGIGRVFGIMRPIFRERGKLFAEVSGRLTESLGGVRVVKGYAAENREAEAFAGGVRRILGNAIRTLNSVSLLSFASSVLMGLIGSVVMLYGGHLVLEKTLSLGSFVTFTVFLGFLVAPIFQVVSIGTSLTEALAGLERTRELLDERPEDEDPARTVPLGEVRGEVTFESVSFSYDGRSPAVSQIELHAEPGQITALVGPSGAGKSTIINLVAGFYTPSHGRVLVDGTDLSTVKLTTYRSQLGVVLQETFLFDGTIRQNVAFSRPDASAAEIDEACRIARVDEFALSFEQGYDTVVGERGVRLSGGQKQRVSIARAVLARPRILILDEATSSLDSESEALIQEGLSHLMKDRTTFVIAHRLSTIQRADQILVVESGRIRERGRHEALLAARGRYWELYTQQHRLETNLFLPATEDQEAEDDAPSGDQPSGPGGLIENIVDGRHPDDP